MTMSKNVVSSAPASADCRGAAAQARYRCEIYEQSTAQGVGAGISSKHARPVRARAWSGARQSSGRPERRELRHFSTAKPGMVRSPTEIERFGHRHLMLHRGDCMACSRCGRALKPDAITLTSDASRSLSRGPRSDVEYRSRVRRLI